MPTINLLFPRNTTTSDVVGVVGVPEQINGLGVKRQGAHGAPPFHRV